MENSSSTNWQLWIICWRHQPLQQLRPQLPVCHWWRGGRLLLLVCISVFKAPPTTVSNSHPEEQQLFGGYHKETSCRAQTSTPGCCSGWWYYNWKINRSLTLDSPKIRSPLKQFHPVRDLLVPLQMDGIVCGCSHKAVSFCLVTRFFFLNILKKLRFGVFVSYVSHSDVVVILCITLRLLTGMKEKRTNDLVDHVIFQWHAEFTHKHRMLICYSHQCI